MSYTPTQWQTGDTITAEKLNNMERGIENANEPFIVRLTPTAADFSGTMDKTPQEITAAHEARQEIVFNVVGFPGFDEVNIPVAWFTYATDDTICSASATLVDINTNLQIIVVTSNIADDSTYFTTIYSLTPMS